MSTIPFCSICIANYNGVSYLPDCLDSVLSQKFEGSVEIIVHDDFSDDGSIHLIREKYPDVVLIESNENVGFCISNNRMVERAKGELILLLNNDANLRQGALQSLFLEYKKYGDGIYGLPQYNMETGELIDRGSVFDFFFNPIPNVDPSLASVGMIIGACLWLPKSLWEVCGGFPAWFESLAEDMYLCCLAHLFGYPVRCLPVSGFNHWVGKSLGGGKVVGQKKLVTTLRRRSLSERNKTYVLVMCFPGNAMWVLLLLHFFLLIFEGATLSIIKRDKKIWVEIYWRCIRDVFLQKKNLMEKRRSIQKRRKITIFDFCKFFSPVPYKLKMLFRYGVPSIKYNA